jgi:hypothetical protein
MAGTITGQVGHVLVAKQPAMIDETDLDTMNLSEIATNAWSAFVITEESMVAEAAPLMADGEIGRGRDRTGAVAAGYGIAGGFGGNARVFDIGKLIQFALNDDWAAPDGGSGVTTVAPGTYVSWVAVEKNVGDTLYLWLVNSKVNNFTLSASSNALATYSVDFVTMFEKSIGENEAHEPTYVGDDLLAFHGGLLELGGSQYNNMESVEVSIANNLSNDEYTVRPSRFLNNVTEGQRAIDLNFSQVFTDKADYENYTYGEVGRTTPGYKLYEDEVTFTMMNDQAKATATQWIAFDFPRVMFGGLPITLTSGRIVVSNTGVVLAPTVGDIVTVTYL